MNCNGLPSEKWVKIAGNPDKKQGIIVGTRTLSEKSEVVKKEMSENVSDERVLRNRAVYADGIQEQIVLLDELSQKLEEYFALRTIKSDALQGKF
jgi:hypothetical protein